MRRDELKGEHATNRTHKEAMWFQPDSTPKLARTQRYVHSTALNRHSGPEAGDRPNRFTWTLWSGSRRSAQPLYMDTLVRKQENGSTASHGRSGPEAGDRDAYTRKGSHSSWP